MVLSMLMFSMETVAIEITHNTSHMYAFSTHTHDELAKACNANYSILKFRKSCAIVYSAGNSTIRMFA